MRDAEEVEEKAELVPDAVEANIDVTSEANEGAGVEVEEELDEMVAAAAVVGWKLEAGAVLVAARRKSAGAKETSKTEKELAQMLEAIKEKALRNASEEETDAELVDGEEDADMEDDEDVKRGKAS